MSDSYYRVDVVRPDGNAGDSVFVRAANKDSAMKALAVVRPDVADWNATPHRIRREDYPMTDLPVIVLPKHSEVIPGADDEFPDDEHDEAYNAYCTNLIRDRLLEMRQEGNPYPQALTQYPSDDDDSRDTVTIGRRDEVVVVDTGSR